MNAAASKSSGVWRDLAPDIHRQRLVVEGVVAAPIDDERIRAYLRELGSVIDMVVLTEPVTHRSDAWGWAGWVHWEASGAHFYAWERPLLFFSVDIYACKAFSDDDAIAHARAFFGAPEIAARGF